MALQFAMDDSRKSCEKESMNICFKKCRSKCHTKSNSNCPEFPRILKDMAKHFLNDEEFSDFVDQSLRGSSFPPTCNTEDFKTLLSRECLLVLQCIINWGENLLKGSTFVNSFISLVNKVYMKDGYYDSWEFCQNHKSQGGNKYHDYVYGCYSEFANDPDNMKHRHSHQFCIAIVILETVVVLLGKNLNNWLQQSKSFEDLYNRLRARNICGFGPLAVYDTCLRIAYNENRNLMPTRLYYHAGVKWGATALYHISELTGGDLYLGNNNPDKISPDTSVCPNVLNGGFLDAISVLKKRVFHLENKLCCFHEPYFLIETVIRVKVGSPLRKDPNALIKKAKQELAKARKESMAKGKTLRKNKYTDYLKPQDRRYLLLLDLLGVKYTH